MWSLLAKRYFGVGDGFADEIINRESLSSSTAA